MTRGKIRQPGSVLQRYLRLHLIRGQRHAEQCFALSGDLTRDRESVASAFSWLRDTLSELPDDPHLSFATNVESSRSVKTAKLPPAEEVIANVLDAAAGLDLVGIYAAGPVYRGFANSLGQRNWHEVTSFNLQWSLYHRADKAVKTAYGGVAWGAATFRIQQQHTRRTAPSASVGRPRAATGGESAPLSPPGRGRNTPARNCRRPP